MNWYLTKIVFRIICENEETAQFDEQLRLIQATDEHEAFEKAIKIGKTEDQIFLNKNQKSIHWKFINVTELQKITSFSDGMELYSTTQEPENAEKYTSFLNKKSSDIELKTLIETALI
jgi:hypothetical protein